MSTLRMWGLLLLAGAVITLGLHQLHTMEHLYRFLYDQLLSGLDVPEEPPGWTVDLIGYVSLIGGILELAVGVALLAIDDVRRRRSAP